FTYDTNPHGATITTTPLGVSNTVNYSRVSPAYNSATPPTNAGTYTVDVTITDTNYQLSGSGSGSITINPANVTVSITGGPFTYDTNPHGATITTTPLGVSNTVNYSRVSPVYNSATPPTNAGTY